MSEYRFTHCFIGASISWGLASITWGAVVTGFAIGASVVTIWAGIETALWRRKQRRDK